MCSLNKSVSLQQDRWEKNCFISQFAFQALSLLDNTSFLFYQLADPDSSLWVTESLCQDFGGTISINCGQFYSVGWRCLTLLTTNCSAFDAVWGPPAWNWAEWMGELNVQVKEYFPSCREMSHATTWLVRKINWLCFTGEMWEIAYAVSWNNNNEQKLSAPDHQLKAVLCLMWK